MKMKTTYRTTGHDVLQPERKKPEDAPGTLHPHHIPINDHKGRHRGQVGPKATAATVSRFLGVHGATLGTGPDGKQAWLGPKPDSNVRVGKIAYQTAKLDKQRRQARGSVKS